MNNNIKKSIYDTYIILKSSFPKQIFCDICIYIIFLKYILDNEKLPYNKISFDLQRIFDLSKLDDRALIGASIALEEQYNFPQNSLVDLAESYIELKKVNVTKKITNILKNIRFTDNGDEIVESLKEFLYITASNFGVIMGKKMTSKPLSSLIKELINVEDGDNYADLAYGIGISTLEIIGNKTCYITGYETNSSYVAVAKMLLIMAGKENVNLINDNVLNIKINEGSFNKIVTMPPFDVKTEECNMTGNYILEKFNLPKQKLNPNILILLKSLDLLDKDGIAAIAITKNFLYSKTLMDKTIRKYLVENHLKAVIQLPNLYYGSGVSTIVLIIEKKKQNKNILFIDASNNAYFDFFNNSQKTIESFCESGITKIKEIYKEERYEKGISYVANIEEIKKNNFLLTLAKYIKIENHKESINNSDIDKRLKELYSELKNILKDY